MPVDSSRFDDVTRVISASGSRRRLVSSLAAGALGLVWLGRTEAAVCRSVGSVCREHANCCSGRCGAKDRTGRRQCVCQTDADCPGYGDRCREVACENGVCTSDAVTPVVTLADCGGRCNGALAASVTLCEQTVTCPECADCFALGCPGGGGGLFGPAPGRAIYCLATTASDGSCGSSSTDCPAGPHVCSFLGNCYPICLG